MIRECVDRWRMCQALGFLVLAVGCSGEERPATTQFTTRSVSSTHGAGGSAGESSGSGSGGGSTTDSGGSATSGTGGGAASAIAPVVEILAPEDASQPDAVFDATLDVSCKVTESEQEGATPPDPATVIVELLDGDELIDSRAGVEGAEADVYEASFAVQNLASGPITVRCSAADTSPDAAVGSDQVQAFLDHGPLVTVIAPLPAAAESPLGAVVFEYDVVPDEIVSADAGASIETVELMVKGQAFEIAPLEDEPDTYRTTIDFSDPTLFPETPEGSVSVALTATNARGVAHVERYDFLLDSEGPNVSISSPRDGDVVGGTVSLVIALPEDVSGVNLDTLEVELNDIIHHYDPDGTWAVGEDEVVFQFEAAALGGGAQITAIVRVDDNAGNLGDDSALFNLDEFGPIVMLDPPNFRAVDSQDRCSHSFDPLGISPNHAARVDSTEVYRALVWDRTNSAGGSVLFMAGADPSRVQLFVRTPDAPLVVDTTDDGICDDIFDPDDALAFQNLTRLGADGSAWFGTEETDPGPDEPPREACEYGTSSTAPKFLCDDESDLKTVAHHSDESSEAVVYAIAPGQDNPLCKGLEWELTTVFPSYEGWVCLAARAFDHVGNRGVSKPLAVCIDGPASGQPSCWTDLEEPPPTCTDDCDDPPALPAGGVFYEP